jgi:hypothetical protein
MTDTGEVIEFCDPRIQTIKKQLKKFWYIEITTRCISTELKDKIKA